MSSGSHNVENLILIWAIKLQNEQKLYARTQNDQNLCEICVKVKVKTSLKLLRKLEKVETSSSWPESVWVFQNFQKSLNLWVNLKKCK